VSPLNEVAWQTMIEKILPTLLLFGGFYLVTKNLGSRGLHSDTR